MVRVTRCSNKNPSCSVKFDFQINNIFVNKVCLKYYMGHSHTNHKYCMGIVLVLALVTNIPWDIVILKKQLAIYLQFRFNWVSAFFLIW